MGQPTIYKPSVYNGNGIYNNGAGSGGGGYKPQGTYNFSNLENLTNTGSATVDKLTVGPNIYSMVKNANDFKVFLLNNIFEFSKITLKFKRLIKALDANYIDFYLCGSDEEILITRCNNTIGNYRNQLINIPSGVSYNLASDGFTDVNGGKTFACTDSTYNNNAIEYKYIIQNNRIEFWDLLKNSINKIGTLEFGLSNFVGFRFNNENSSNSQIGISDITITIE